jgi:hypothetical protein
MEEVSPVFKKILDDLSSIEQELDRIQNELQGNLDLRLARLEKIKKMARRSEKTPPQRGSKGKASGRKQINSRNE